MPMCIRITWAGSLLQRNWLSNSRMGPGDLYLTTWWVILMQDRYRPLCKMFGLVSKMNKPQFLTIRSLEVQGGRRTMVILCDEHNNSSFRGSEWGKDSLSRGAAVLKDVDEKRRRKSILGGGQALQAPSHEEMWSRGKSEQWARLWVRITGENLRRVHGSWLTNQIISFYFVSNRELVEVFFLVFCCCCCCLLCLGFFGCTGFSLQHMGLAAPPHSWRVRRRRLAPDPHGSRGIHPERSRVKTCEVQGWDVGSNRQRRCAEPWRRWTEMDRVPLLEGLRGERWRATGNAAEASHCDGFWLHPLGCHGRRSQGLTACRGQGGRKAVRRKGLDHVGAKARRVDDFQESWASEAGGPIRRTVLGRQ